MIAKYEKYANIFAKVTLLGALIFPLLSFVVWGFWDQFSALIFRDMNYAFDLNLLTATDRLLGFGVSIIGALIQSYGLLGLRETFLQAANGQALSSQAINGFRRFAWVTLIMVFLSIIQRAAYVAIFSTSDPAFQGMLEIQLGSPELNGLFMGFLLVFVALVFDEGKKTKEENDAFL